MGLGNKFKRMLYVGREYTMRDNARELEKQIAEKNNLLTALVQNESMNREKIKGIKIELDRLLYLYYKSIKGVKPMIGLL